jgi:hypothetical protein
MSNAATNENWQGFSLSIANFRIQANCNHSQLAQKLRQRYHEFQTPQKPNLRIDVQWMGTERSSSLLDTKTAFRNGVLAFSALGYQGFIDEKKGQGKLQLSSAHPVEDIDYYLRVAFALLANAAGGILMHTAGILRDKRAYLFFGHSGSGKTTVCQVSAEVHTILNDDLILLLPRKNSWRAYGTPFWNPTQIKPSNQSAPVVGMYHLIQSKKVYAQKMGEAQATAALIANVPVIPQDPMRSKQLLETLSQLQKTIPIFELHFLPDDSFWNVILD